MAMRYFIDEAWAEVGARDPAARLTAKDKEGLKFTALDQGTVRADAPPSCGVTIAEVVDNLARPDSIHAVKFGEAVRVFLADNLRWFSDREDMLAERLRAFEASVRAQTGKAWDELDTTTREPFLEERNALTSEKGRVSVIRAEVESALGEAGDARQGGRALRNRGQGVSPLLNQLVEGLTSLDALVGLESVKRAIVDRVEYAIFYPEDFSLNRHLNVALFGSPGTGKTTVAEILARIYSGLGILASSSSTAEVTDKSGLVASFEGQTGRKTRLFMIRTLGTVGIVDEAYGLAEGGSGSGGGGGGYGQEAIDVMVKLTSDFKGRLILIVAGYEDKMEKQFFGANDGLRSRFPERLIIPNFSARQLTKIAMGDLEAGAWTLTRAAEEAVEFLIDRAHDQDFFSKSNGRGALDLARVIKEAHTCSVADQVRQLEQQRAPAASFRGGDKTVTLEDVKRGFTTWARKSQPTDRNIIRYPQARGRSIDP